MTTPDDLGIERRALQPTKLRIEIEAALNRVSAENGSDTPDFILAEFLEACLAALDVAVNARRVYYGDAE